MTITTCECSGCKSERVIVQVEPCELAEGPPLLWCESCQQAREAAGQVRPGSLELQAQALVARFREDPGMTLAELGLYLLVRHIQK